MFAVIIENTSDAFEGDSGPAEVACLLRRIADTVLNHDLADIDNLVLHDSNGNTCGVIVVSPPKSPEQEGDE